MTLALVAACSACSTDNFASRALSAIGLGKSDAEKPPREVSLTIAAASNLNAAKTQKPAALVVKIYALKDATAFSQAPFDAFISEDGEKRALGNDILSSKEITLLPGKNYVSVEKIPRVAQAIGVVALFRAPGAQRWRIAFDPARSQKAGIALTAEACAMSVSKGVVAGDALSASPARCG